MRLQIIEDDNGNATGVYIPIKDWNIIASEHQDLKQLLVVQQKPLKRLSELIGTISATTAADMQQYVKESRGEWEKRTQNL